jgi:hypothetical protein
MVMFAAAGIKGGITIWALIAARHVLYDAQLISAGAAENRRLVPLLLRPDLNRVVCQRQVALFTCVIHAAAFHPNGDDVEVGPVMSAACHGIEIDPANFRVRRWHTETDYRSHGIDSATHLLP